MSGTILRTQKQSLSYLRQILQDDNEIDELIELWKVLWYQGMTPEQRTQALAAHAEKFRAIMRQYDLADRDTVRVQIQRPSSIIITTNNTCNESVITLDCGLLGLRDKDAFDKLGIFKYDISFYTEPSFFTSAKIVDVIRIVTF